jgi:hypothetical protein
VKAVEGANIAEVRTLHAEHSQTCLKDRSGAVAVRAALASAAQLGRGDDVNSLLFEQASRNDPTLRNVAICYSHK